MDQLKLIPKELIQIIPVFEGDNRQLNLFLRKCEYVISGFMGNAAQNLYVMHTITSRLKGNAASLISEREDVLTWIELKELLTQHFGEPRSEDCIAIELETLKIRSHESYLEFCNRVQSVRSTLMSKVNLLADVNLRNSKKIIYDHMALNVFLYNLSDDLVRIVRLKVPDTLEKALEIVLEEVNFRDQYNARSRMRDHKNISQPLKPMTQFKFGVPSQPSGFKPIQFNNNNNSNFRFGNPQPQLQKPAWAMPNNSNSFGQAQNYQYPRPQFQNLRPPFGFQPQTNQFGYRPPNQQFNFQPFRPLAPRSNQFQQQTRPQFGGSLPKPITTDVSMRTAPPRNQIRSNELYFNDGPSDEQYDYDCSQDYNDFVTTDDSEQVTSSNNHDLDTERTTDDEQTENFCMTASTSLEKR